MTVGRTTASTRIILTVVGLMAVFTTSFGSTVTYGGRRGSSPALPSEIAESPASVVGPDSWSTAGTDRLLAIESVRLGDSRLNRAANGKSKSVTRYRGLRWRRKRKNDRNHMLTNETIRRGRMQRERKRMEKSRLDMRRLDKKRMSEKKMDETKRNEERTRTSKTGTDDSEKMAGDRLEKAVHNGMNLRKNQRFPGNEIIIDGRTNNFTSLFAASPPAPSPSSVPQPPSPSSVPVTVSKTVAVDEQDRIVVGITQAARSVVFVMLFATSVAVIAALCRGLRSSPRVAAIAPKPVRILPPILVTVLGSPLPAKKVHLLYDVV